MSGFCLLQNHIFTHPRFLLTLQNKSCTALPHSHSGAKIRCYGGVWSSNVIGPLYWDTTLQQAAVAVTCEREGQISVGNWMWTQSFLFLKWAHCGVGNFLWEMNQVFSLRRAQQQLLVNRSIISTYFISVLCFPIKIILWIISECLCLSVPSLVGVLSKAGHGFV